MKRSGFLLPFVLFFCLKTYAQVVTEKVDSQTLLSRINIAVAEKIPTIQISPVANSKIALGENDGFFRYGIPIENNINLNNSGEWYNSSNGNKIWAVKLSAKNAKSMDVEFDVFKLSKNSYIQIYSLKDNIIQSPIVYNENNVNRSFATDLIYSDEIIIELVTPSNEMDQNIISINKIVYGYYDKGSTQLSIQGSDAMASALLTCHNDVNCYSSFSDEKGAVAMLKYNGGFFGSSVLINDGANVARYLLSSRHQWSYVVSGNLLANYPDKLDDVVVKFFYMTSSCNGSAYSKDYSVTGVTLKKEYSGADPDLVLCKLIAEPVWFKNCTPCQLDKAASYIGWSIINDEPTSMAGIHHPGGDLMKITFYDFLSTGYNSNAGYIYVSEYTSGRTELGSSGGAMLDQNKRLIGILQGYPGGIPPTCTNQIDQWSVRIAKHWDGLSQFLDPNNAGIVTLNTRTISNNNPSSTTPYLAKDKSAVCYGQTATIEIANFGEIFENNVTWTSTNSGIINSIDGNVITDYGSPFDGTCTMQNGFFIVPRDSLKVQISWIPLSSQHFSCILKNENVPLAKGNYLTEFSSTFIFNDNEHSFDLDRSFKIEFKII